MPSTTISPAKSAEFLRKLAHTYKTLWLACTLVECDIADEDPDSALDRLARIKAVLAKMGEGSSNAAGKWEAKSNPATN